MMENSFSAEETQTTEAPQEVAPKPKYKKTPKKKFAPGELSGKTKETLKKIKLVGGQMLTGEPVPPPRPEEVRGQKIDWSNRHGFLKRHIHTPELRAKYFGKLLVYAYAGKGISTTGKPSSLWKARCDCGKHITISAWDLKQGRKKHCGCGPTPPIPLKHLFQSTQAPQNPSVDPALVFARESLIAYACLQWAGYEPAAHHQLIAKYLEKVERGEIKRLMIFQPPRSGKSMLVSEYFPAWFLGKNPGKLVVTASYGQELASDFGRKVRNQIADPLFPKLFNGVTIAEDSSAIDKFNLNSPNKGGYFAVGVGGALTGRGANCLSGETKIITEIGELNIDTLVQLQCRPKVLSFNHEKNSLEFKSVVAVQESVTDELIEIRTSSGNSILSTGNHVIYGGERGYRSAEVFEPGDGVVLCEVEIKQSMPPMWSGKDWARNSLQPLLFQGSESRCCLKVREMRSGVYKAALRVREKFKKGAYRFLLLCKMLFGTSCYKKQAEMLGLREDCFEKNKEVLRGTFWISYFDSNYEGLLYLWGRVQSKIAQNCVLFFNVCGFSAFKKNDRERKFSLQGWNKLCEAIFGNAGIGYGERSLELCGLSCSRGSRVGLSFGLESYPRQNNIKSSSHQSHAAGQPTGKPCDDVQDLSFGTPQVRTDTVSVVRRIRSTGHKVYDIQVEGNSNFFANQILVHNCLIIDDPTRSRADADSESNRRQIKDWYTAVAYTRLMPEGAIVICQTRWNVNDLSGWLLEEHKHENWVVLNLPAINSKGEALWPERYPLETLYQIKKTLPSRDWEALYQQKPFIEEGGIFKREWWKMWPENKKFPTCSFVIQAWDTATTDKDLKSNSYSARTTWGIFQGPDDEVPNVILLEAWKERVEFPELQKEALRAYREYEPDKVLIEKKSSGQQLIQILRRMGLPLVEFLPEKIGDKTARAYAAQNLFENGRVYYPSRRWAEDVIDELARFSPSSPNDLTDSSTSALIWLQKSWLLQHSDLKEDDDPTEEEEADDLLPSNVRRFKPRKRSAYG
jgi:predicted phage terminase large subunit-like protein